MGEKVKKILIANRAEIASRVIRTCDKLGIETVAIYTDVDSNLPFVKQATYCECLGSGEVSETYINKDLIVEIAKKHKVDGIHPGYGFLSENSEFGKLLEKNGITFIGPRAKNILLMGDKLESKKFVQSLKLPTVPGYNEDNQDADHLKKQAIKIGFPLLIKASAGGGGKGMKIVEKESDFLEKLSSAKSEAMKFFGNDRVILEKYLINPRHIEIQVLGDGQGDAVHLFERECSIQRRYQKVIEETPATNITQKLRNEMCEMAVSLAKGMKYRGAGTVELILAESGEFYFLEMNTRLQVEHAITEMITGVDLVQEQIYIATHDKLNISQDEIHSIGHSIECRIYAEDPFNNFLPQAGDLEFIGKLKDPTVRLDTSYEDGNTVSTNYDPMMAKVITHDRTRVQNIRKMVEALVHLPFLGVQTNRDFLIKTLEYPKFLEGKYHTHSLEAWMDELCAKSEEDLDDVFASFNFLSKKSRKSGINIIEDAWMRSSGQWLG